MANLFDIDLLDRETLRAISQFLGAAARGVYEAAPKRAMALYGALVVGTLLWIAPVQWRWNPRITMWLTLASMGTLAIACDQLEKYQAELEEAEEDRLYQRSLLRQSAQMISTTQRYAEVTAARLSLSDVLPSHLVEPDLQEPKEDASFEEFKAFMGDALPSGQDKKVAPAAAAVIAGDDNDDGVIALPASEYRFYTLPNPQTGIDERCVTLNGHTHYAGFPIVNLAAEMAKESRSCIGVGPTGTGKSELLKQAISAQHRIDESTDFTIFAHKSANSARGEKLDYCGLEKSQDCYVLTASMNGRQLEDAATAVYHRLLALQGVMEAGSQVPSVLVIDQVNQGIAAAEKAERWIARLNEGVKKEDQYNPYPHLAETYSEDLTTILVDGREKLVKTWAFGHANTNKALGLDQQIKENVFYVGLGRANNYSAVANPLKDNRFIESQQDRDRLRQDLDTYLKVHREYGGPVNVVVAITDCGNLGWRLVVLPQLEKPEPITLGFTNPPKNGIVLYGETDEESSEPELMDKTDIEAAREALIKQEKEDTTKQYSKDQIQKAINFIYWLDENAADVVDSYGLIDPELAAFGFAEVNSKEELELILELLTDEGKGKWETHPYTNTLAWRRFGQKTPPTFQAEIKSKKAQAAGSESTLDPLPPGITEEMFDCFVDEYLSKLHSGESRKVHKFVSNSYKLANNHNMKVLHARLILNYLHSKGIVDFPDLEGESFTFLGFPLD